MSQQVKNKKIKNPSNSYVLIQALLFPRNKFTMKKAIVWTRKNNLKVNKIQLTKRYIRIRQYDPRFFNKFKNLFFDEKGIRAIWGYINKDKGKKLGIVKKK